MLDNISQEKTEEDVNPKISDSLEDSDIQFEEVIDVDKIQKELMQQFGEGNADDDFIVDSETPNFQSNETAESTAFVEKRKKAEIEASRIELGPNDKKYVVYIDYDNIDIMENLSPIERKETINKILKDQNRFATKKRLAQEQARFLKHLGVATVTFIIGFPLLFLCVNKAMEATMQNYKEAKINFSKLYKNKGKIKTDTDSSALNFKY